MSVTTKSSSRDRTVEAVTETRLKELTGLQNRLDEAEAELAALSVMARKRGLDFLKGEARPLLDELGELVTRIRDLILDDAPLTTLGPLSGRDSGAPVLSRRKDRVGRDLRS
jgi:hypothetical protein